MGSIARTIANSIQTDGTLDSDASNSVNFRNLIINGDMSIAQRSTSETSVSGSGYYTVDRFRYGAGSGIVNTFSQSTDVPSGQGFKYSHKQEATTGDASLAAAEYNIFQQRLEGYTFQSAKFGTSNAESLTLSFWIKASVTGTYVCELENVDAGRAQSQSFTVSSASTWEKKTITFSGDTSNAINIDNGRGLDLNWWLGAGTDFTSGTLQTTWGTQTAANRAVGATNAFASNNDTVFITGVQLEIGTTASDFEFLPYDVNLQRCYRYYELLATGSGKMLGFGGTYNANTPAFVSYYHFKRVTPSIDQASGTDYYRIYGNGVEYKWSAYSALFQATQTQGMLYGSGTISQGLIGLFDTISGSSYIAYDAEL